MNMQTGGDHCVKKKAFNEYHIESLHTYDEMREIILNACQSFECIISKRQYEKGGERQLILYYYKVAHHPEYFPLLFSAEELLIILSECHDGSTTVTASSIPLTTTPFEIRCRYCSRIMEIFIQNTGNIGKKVYLSPAQEANNYEAKTKSVLFVLIPAILIILIAFLFIK